LPGLAGAVIGAFVGHAFAVTLDAAVFAIEPASPAASAPDEARAAPATTLRLAPSLGIGPRGVSAGVGGTF
jgi:hypothetical protein